jgi:outer membrane protein assembly factor BamB
MNMTLLIAALGTLVPAQEWSQYRGPGGKGDATASTLVTSWSKDSNVVWHLPVPGKAWSSPIVHQGHAWLTNATADGKKLSLVKVDLKTGKIAGDFLLREVAEPQFCIPYNSYASCTPTARDGKIYVHFGSALTACVDADSGKVIWQRTDLPCNHHRGPGSSPLLWNDRLFLIYDGFDVQYVAALDIATGKTTWKADRGIDYGTDNGDMKKAYATPALLEVDGKPQLVCPSAGSTISYDPSSGKEIWRVKHGGMNASSIPQSSGGLVYLASGDGGWSLGAVRLGRTGKLDDSAVAWKTARGATQYNSIITKADLLFTASEKGFASCLEAATGVTVWQERLGNKFHASPILAKSGIYLFDDQGKGYVLAAERKYQVIGGGQLPDGCMASPAVAGNLLLVRTRTGLYALGQK